MFMLDIFDVTHLIPQKEVSVMIVYFIPALFFAMIGEKPGTGPKDKQEWHSIKKWAMFRAFFRLWLFMAFTIVFFSFELSDAISSTLSLFPLYAYYWLLDYDYYY